jgi:hypothetical protein
MHPLNLTPDQERFANEKAGDLTLAPVAHEKPTKAQLLQAIERTERAYSHAVAEGTYAQQTARWHEHVDAKLAFSRAFGRPPEFFAGIWR